MSVDDSDTADGLTADEIDARRRQDILDHREEVRERWFQLRNNRMQGRITKKIEESAGYEIAEWYLAQIGPLANPDLGDEPPTEVDWWYGRTVGGMRWPREHRLSDDAGYRSVDSLNEFAHDLQPLEVVRWTEEQDTEMRGRVEVARSAEVTPPLSLSKTAIRMVDHFLLDIGMALDLSSSSGGASFSADDKPSDWG